MKNGDMVRFVYPGTTNKRLGLLVEYHTWEKIATILYEDILLRVHANDVQKAGKKDFIITL